MERKLLLTDDGSHTILVPGTDITFHSRYGAIQESVHVFIEAGLKYIMNVTPGPLRIFEMGFGTGLNALLTSLEVFDEQRPVTYKSIDAFPLEPVLMQQLNHASLINDNSAQVFDTRIREASWNQQVQINEYFTLEKVETTLEQAVIDTTYHLVYFDAFSPTDQPELWSFESFRKIFDMLLPGGVLTTYCSRSAVRRTMSEAGFKVEKIPGPRGKREMVRAHKRGPIE